LVNLFELYDDARTYQRQCNYVNILIIVGPVNKSTGKNLFKKKNRF